MPPRAFVTDRYSYSVFSLMKTLVLGATGGTGLKLVKRLVERGHTIGVLARSPEKLGWLATSVAAVKGSPLSAPQLSSAIRGHDAVLSCFGPRDPKNHEPLVAPFAKALTSAMYEAKVSRLIILSVAFLFKNSILPPAYPLGQLLFRHHVNDCAEMEAIVRSSSLDWTIVRPAQLTDKPPSGKYRVRAGHLPFMGFTVSRADVADFMVTAMEQSSFNNKIVGICD